MLDAAGTPVGEQTVSALAPAAISVASTQVTIPANTPPGRWYLIGSTDGPSALVEAVEANNMGVPYIDISAP